MSKISGKVKKQIILRTKIFLALALSYPDKIYVLALSYPDKIYVPKSLKQWISLQTIKSSIKFDCTNNRPVQLSQ